MSRLAILAVLVLAAGPALAASALQVIGAPALGLDGERVGTVEDLIVDTTEGEVVYIIIRSGERYRTLPARAMREASPPRIDMGLAGEAAAVAPDPRFRRAARLLGQEVSYPGKGPIGGIRDMEFDAATGEIVNVTVASRDGSMTVAPSVLAHGRFPPLTRWHIEPTYPIPETGYTMKPSDERTRTHDHVWERR